MIKSVVWRLSTEILKEEGLDLENEEEELLCERVVKVVENGISYMNSLDGQKTGFYVDQRENREFISTISDGQRVLAMCCYTGGFALNAVHGHALEVTGVDTSSPTLEVANHNVILNNLDPGKISFLKQDVDMSSSKIITVVSIRPKWHANLKVVSLFVLVHIFMSQGESFPNLHGQLDVTRFL
ncbi:unnamed protein product [Lactuca saligna]|uniref:S-adenosylmethionine-dependent methyltransferase domain-containing protein n=1 Tax=Lactuca saligna TaxID=75948 RepID=A0AA35YU17_LACSI|nr:unnamed protein product [Lactuca saligna]